MSGFVSAEKKREKWLRKLVMWCSCHEGRKRFVVSVKLCLYEERVRGMCEEGCHVVSSCQEGRKGFAVGDRLG